MTALSFRAYTCAELGRAAALVTAQLSPKAQLAGPKVSDWRGGSHARPTKEGASRYCAAQLSNAACAMR